MNQIPKENCTESATVLIESRDNAINELRQLIKRWDNRLVVEGALTKCYMEGRCEMLVEFEVSHGRQIYDLLAIFNRSSSTVDKGHAPLVYFNRKIGNTAIVDTGDQEFVFIANVKIMDGSERAIPSLVRFQRPNYIDDIWAGAVYMSLFDSVLKVLPIFTEREINVVKQCRY